MLSLPLPHGRRGRLGHTSAGLLVLLLAAIGAIILSAAPAAAHDALISSDPPDGSAPASAPTAVRLTFSEPVQQRYASVAVTDHTGRRVDQGKPDVSGAVVSVTLQPLAAAGRYTVGWRVVSADGHSVAGTLHFKLSASAVTTAQRPTQAASAVPAVPPATDIPNTPATAAAQAFHGHASSGSAGNGNFVTDHAWHFLIGGVVVLAGLVLLWRERRMAR